MSEPLTAEEFDAAQLRQRTAKTPAPVLSGDDYDALKNVSLDRSTSAPAEDFSNVGRKHAPASIKESVLDSAIQLPAGIARGLGGVGDLILRGIANVAVNNPVALLDSTPESRAIVNNLRDAAIARHGFHAAVDRAVPASETVAGDYANSAGEVIGGSIPFLGATYASAPAQAAAAPATSWLGRVFQSAAQQFVDRPVRTVALDLAGAGSAGVARQAAEDAGMGQWAQLAASVAGGMAPGLMASYASAARGTAGAPIGSPTAQSIARQRQIAADADLAAFERTGVRTFGPAFNQGPVASVAKQLSETPIIGSTLRNNLDETYQGMADASRRLSTEISPTATAETAGMAVQRGLDRFRNDGISKLEPATVERLGVASERQGPRRAVMSDGAAEARNEAVPIRQAIGADVTQTTRGATVPSARPLSETMMMRTSARNLTEPELEAIIRAPANETSVAARAEALYERAWRKVPEMKKINNQRNPNLVNATATREALGEIDSSIANNIAGQRLINGDLVARLRNQHSNKTLDDLRSIRTEIGRSLNTFNPLVQSLDRTQLRRLYGAVSNDIEVGLETLANRAALRTAISPNRPDYVTPEVAREAAGALRAFRTADRYFRLSTDRMDRFAQVLQAQSPEMATRRVVQSFLDGGKGNIQMARAAMAGLRPEERAEVASLVVQSMGRPVASAKGIVQESGFSANTFATNYQKMAPEARDLLFTPEHRAALDDLYRVSSRIANVEAQANTSRSGTNAINLGGGAAAIGTAAHGDFVTPLAIGASGVATSILMSRPAYTRWLSQYIHLRAAVRDGSDAAFAPLMRHLGGLERSARLNPELWPVYYAATKEANDIKPGKNRAQQIDGSISTPTPGAGKFASPSMGPSIRTLRPQSVPPGSSYSPSRGQWRSPDGKLYDGLGNPL